MPPGASSGKQSGGWGQEMSGDAPKSGRGSPPIDPQVAVQGAKASSPHVFISYASQDAAVAERLCATLEAAGLPCWIAPRDVEAGALYADAIVRAINEAKAVVLVMSASAIGSDHVAREVERAASKHKPIIAFRIDAAALNPGLEYFLSNSQWIDVPAIGMPAGLAKLTQAAGHGSGSTVAAVHGASAKPLERPGGRAKLIVGAAVVITVGVAVALGVHFWSQSHKAGPPGAAVAITDKSIAVLPFVDMSEKHDQEYFSDGLSEELIDMLTKVPELRVPARTSSFYFKGKQATIADIAKALGVAHVLEGSVRKSGNTLRVTAQLIRVDNGYHVWSETYDRKLEDIFKVQDEIASAVVTALRAHLLPTQPVVSRRTLNAEAYNQLLLGRQFFNRGTPDDRRRAVAAYSKAIALDPNYAAAYAGLAYAEAYVFDSTGDAAGMKRAEAAADRAVALAPEQADGYAARGFVRFGFSWDWAGAQADFAKALALDPADSTVLRRFGSLLASLGRLPQAVVALRKATALDPLSNPAWEHLGRYLMLSRDFAGAHEALHRALEIQPESPYGLNDLGELLLLEGNAAEALATFRKVVNEDLRLSGIAMAEHTVGRAKESQQALDELIAKYAHEAAFQIAESYAWRGEKDKAFEWLERAYQQRDGGLTEIKGDLPLASLRGDRRYKALLHKMNLPE
jgi:TolB-like protein/tetratricopeptide (TPR) repeat protein